MAVSKQGMCFYIKLLFRILCLNYNFLVGYKRNSLLNKYCLVTMTSFVYVFVILVKMKVREGEQ